MKILILVALVSLVVASVPLRCGTVSDGISNQDIDVQASTSRIAASWPGFEDGKERNRILRYEWAVVSSSQAGKLLTAGECQLQSVVLGLPNVLGWTNAETSTSGSANVHLKNGETYYVVVRATTALGVQKYSNSDGVTVDTSVQEERLGHKRDKNKVTKDSTANINAQCPIDLDNACSAGQVSVRDFLEQFYGPAQFLADNSAVATFRILPFAGVSKVIDDDDDDDDRLSDGDVIGIAIGITSFFCFLVIGIILLTSLGTSAGGKFDTNVRRHENVEEF